MAELKREKKKQIGEVGIGMHSILITRCRAQKPVCPKNKIILILVCHDVLQNYL
jgi:hypothetical protein